MITSLMFNKVVAVGMNKESRFKYEKDIFSVKDIPFVRHHFSAYEDETIKFMGEMQEKFNYSVHLAEISIGENAGQAIEDFNKIATNLKGFAIFIYVNVTDEEVALETLLGDKLGVIGSLVQTGSVNRLCLVDKSTTLNAESLNKINKNLVTALGIKDDFIAICGSPLSFGSNCCLTAEKARELQTLLLENAEEAVKVSANHQCMECCGCIRYKLVASALLEVQAPVGVSKKKSEDGQELSDSYSVVEKESAPKKKKLAFKALPNYRSMKF